MIRPLAALALGLTLGAAPAGAEPAPLDRMRLSRDLFDTAIALQDPLLILAAARLRKTVEPRRVERKPRDGSAAQGAPMGWRDMLAAAELLIEGDPALVGIAADIAAERDKGVAIGPVYSIAEIAPKGRDTYPKLPFSGGKYAEIYVEGPSGVDLNVTVHDAKGRLVCSDTDISAIAYCGWRPAADGRFVVTVENRSAEGGRYSLISN